MSDQTETPRIGRRLLAAGIGLAVLAVVALNVFVVPRVFGDEGDRPDPAQVAAAAITTDLQTLAAGLASAPAVRYTGNFRAAGRDAVFDIDARITAAGTLLGSIRTAGTTAEVLEIGARTFVRADAAFWAFAGVVDEREEAFTGQWVLVPETFLGIDLTGAFGATALAAGVAAPASAPVTGADGVRVTAGDRIFHLGTDEPRRLISVSAAPSAGHRYELKPVALDTAGQAVFFTGLRKSATELATATDLGSLVVQKGRAVLQACGPTSCTAKIAFTNRIRPTAKYVTAGAPAQVSVTIVLNRNGRKAKTCVVPLSLAPGASKVAACAATVRVQNAATWRATHDGVAAALTVAESKEIVTALEAELPA